jgi:hypothetical protein
MLSGIKKLFPLVIFVALCENHLISIGEVPKEMR